MKAFETEESALATEKFRINFTEHDFIGEIPAGTYNAVMARLMGLTYPNFLRYARDNFDAILVGNTGYSYLIFNNKANCDRLVKELNRRWGIMIQKRKSLGLEV